jgi:hypothetical protein
MWVYQQRDSNDPIPCCYAKQFQAVSQETIFARVRATTTKEDFAQAQQSLLSLYQTHLQQMQKDPFHFPSAQTGRHWCLPKAYEQAKHRLQNICLLPERLPPPAPTRGQPPRSADNVVNDIASLADAVKRPGDTFLGEERTDGTTPGESQ